MGKKMIGRIFIAINVLTFLTIAGLIYFFLGEKPAVSYQNIPFPVDKSPGQCELDQNNRNINCEDERATYKTGEVLVPLIDVCKYTEESYLVTQKMVNVDTGSPFYYPHVYTDPFSKEQFGCNSDAKGIPKTIDSFIPTGCYYFEGTNQVPGRWRDFHNVHWRTEEFCVENTGQNVPPVVESSRLPNPNFIPSPTAPPSQNTQQGSVRGSGGVAPQTTSQSQSTTIRNEQREPENDPQEEEDKGVVETIIDEAEDTVENVSDGIGGLLNR